VTDRGEREREREKTSKTRGDYASAIWEQCYVSEPIEKSIQILTVNSVKE
jgi:hypothetical protein